MYCHLPTPWPPLGLHFIFVSYCYVVICVPCTELPEVADAVDDDDDDDDNDDDNVTLNSTHVGDSMYFLLIAVSYLFSVLHIGVTLNFGNVLSTLQVAVKNCHFSEGALCIIMSWGLCMLSVMVFFVSLQHLHATWVLLVILVFAYHVSFVFRSYLVDIHFVSKNMFDGGIGDIGRPWLSITQ